jgi:Xylanase inhibitor N-terminal/Xylanase inhibitor C-terminal
MATSTFSLFSLFLLATLLHTTSGTTSAGACATSPDTSSTLRIIHAFGPCSPLRPAIQLPSWADFLTDQTKRDETRLLFLNSLATTGTGKSFVPVAAGRQLLQVPNYIVRGSLGTPAQNLLLAFDTSNDAAWIPCTGCGGCPAGSPYFNPTTSTSYRPVPCGSSPCSQVPNPTCYPRAKSCSFNFSYAASSFEAGLGQDSLSLASDTISSYTFGCLQKVIGNSLPPQGLLGLGRGQLSFLTQTKSIYGSTFSYCLPSFKSLNFSGTLRLGTKGQPLRIKTTPLLLNPRRSSLYYVNMTGIKVGRRVVAIPPSALAFDPATGAGTVIDSGTMFTQLVRPAYEALRNEFRRQVKGTVTSLGGFDTCYNGPVTIPAITLLFDRMQVTLPEDNVIIHSTAGSLSCLAMAAAPEGMNAVLNVIANMQQQNHRILFDVPNSRVGFARELCT